MTPHIEAKLGEIAKTVLMPGDPLRAEYIAKKYLTNYKLVSKIRNIYAFTGYYNNKEVTVMASGMGMGSMGIYSYELFKFYNVENIIRIGSAGAYDSNLKIGDILLANEVYTDSNFAYVQDGTENNLLKSSEKLNSLLNNENIKIGRILSSDVFYKENDNFTEIFNKYGCVAVEMEAFALLHNASKFNKNATCLLTISDSFITNEKMSAIDRQNSFDKMIELALKMI